MTMNIHCGRRHSPPRLLIYGTEGIGKSTTAAAPTPIFIPTEDGLDQIDCASFPLARNLADVDAALRTLIQEKHDYETVVIDSVDWLEHLSSEYRVRTQGRGRELDEWKIRTPGSDNHWLDALVGAAVAAAMQGAVLFGTDVKRVPRKRIRLSDLQNARRGY